MKKRSTAIGPQITFLMLAGLLASCAPAPDRRGPKNHAFISYHPAAEGHPGPRLAVKDLIDIKGEVTTAGSEYLSKSNPPAKRDAECLAIARERNVPIVG
ncbi:MAG: hypothetical protein ABIT37_09445, partial [Luteolibacter sp.]